jgi:hypothetical protein
MHQNVASLQSLPPIGSQRLLTPPPPPIVTNYVMRFTRRQSLSSTKLALGTMTLAGIAQSGAENLSPHVNCTDRHPHHLLKSSFFGK